MSFYASHILPWVFELVLNQPAIGELRKDLLKNVEGNVLEIGFGTGLNLPHYPAPVHKITALDPHLRTHRLTQKRLRASKIEVSHCTHTGEKLPFPDHAFDSVVTTFTLCSIPDVLSALREIHRVLKPHGKFFFLEHGLSPNPMMARWQHRFTPLQKKLGGGCHLDRNITALIKKSSFDVQEIKEFYFEDFPKMLGFFYCGIAETT